MNIKSSLTSYIGVAILLVSSFAFAGVDVETDENGVILDGYDAVAYFTESTPVKGSAEYTAVHHDAIYYFSSQKNRDLFNQDSEKYAPQFGGFCAYGTTFGKKLEIDGRAFEVVDGKLYVNKSLNVYETWSEEKEVNIQSANVQWPTIKDTPAADL